MQLPRGPNIFGQSVGSSRQAAVSSSRDAFVGAESDLRTRATEASPGAANRISSGQRGSPIGSSDPKRATTSTRNASHVRNYETTMKGIESLQLETDERTR